MTFKTRPGVIKQFDTVFEFGIENLVVSGCSFTYNNHDTACCTWPYYLRDLGGFKQVLDTSMPGAGNNHIYNSLIWSLELKPVDPKTSLVIVMFSGNDRDDYITPFSNINNYPFQFAYTQGAMSAITGGSHEAAIGNTHAGAKDFFATKTFEVRAIENYLYLVHAYNYLQNKGYRFVFLNFLDPVLFSRTCHFDIKQHLPKLLQKNLDHMITDIIGPYEFALKNNLLWDDDFHPSPDGHLCWTKTILLPKLQQLFGRGQGRP